MWVEVYETICFCLFGRDLWAKAVKRLVAWLCQHGLSKSQGMNQKLLEEVMG